MAQKPLRLCSHPGCRVLTRDGWCPKHKPKHKRGESAKWHRLYNLQIWDNLRTRQLLKDPWCAECARKGENVRATVVDHIVPHRGNWQLFTDPNNLQSLCTSCHDRKTMRERQERGERFGK